MKPEYHEIYKTIGLNILYYRNKNGMSQYQLGDFLNKDQSHISKIEKRQSVSLWILYVILQKP